MSGIRETDDIDAVIGRLLSGVVLSSGHEGKNEQGGFEEAWHPAHCVTIFREPESRAGDASLNSVPATRGGPVNVKADEVKHGPAESETLAEWVRGIGTAEKPGLLAQQSIRCLRLHALPML